MKIGKGYRVQSGIPHRLRKKGTPKPGGLLLRGVVTATYITDDPGHPRIDNANNPPSAIYCDVVIYSSMAYDRWFTLNRVLVSQKRGGLHNDDSWKPKAISKNIVTTFNDTVGSNPGVLDGDHVLVGFLNDSFDEPIILKGLPHPSRDVFNELYDSGKRLKLKLVDGDPDFTKHHGVFRGVDDSGNHVIDSTFGNNGTTNEFGKEPEPDITGSSGNQSFNLPQNSEFAITLKDMTNPTSPIEYAKFSIKKEGGNIEFLVDNDNSITINGSDEDASLKLGNGVAKAAIASLLQALWTQMKIIFAGHTHTVDTTIGVTDPPAAVIPSWDDSINSDKLTFPFN